ASSWPGKEASDLTCFPYPEISFPFLGLRLDLGRWPRQPSGAVPPTPFSGVTCSVGSRRAERLEGSPGRRRAFLTCELRFLYHGRRERFDPECRAGAGRSGRH